MGLSIESFSLIFLLVFNLSILVLYFQSLLKLKMTLNSAALANISNLALKETIAFNHFEDTQDVHQENFIKFLSDSRDWAFEYIDKSQKQIKEFVDIADKQFAFFDSWGTLSEGDLYYETMKIVSEEYKKLKQLLPEETDDRR